MTEIYLISSMEHWWDDIYRGKVKFSEKNLYHWHLYHHKSHTERTGDEPAALRREAGD